MNYENVEHILTLAVALGTAGYLIIMKVREANSAAYKAEELADLEHAKALSETAKTASFFLDTAKAQVREHSRQIESLQDEVKEMRAEMRGLHVKVASLEAENRTLREANEWFKKTINDYLMSSTVNSDT